MPCEPCLGCCRTSALCLPSRKCSAESLLALRCLPRGGKGTKPKLSLSGELRGRASSAALQVSPSLSSWVLLAVALLPDTDLLPNFLTHAFIRRPTLAEVCRKN